ncbi:DUF2167 domain-containing protein [Variovorax sp. LT1P1]|uniref:DUF2167 domain-containing protein n=1 Tax=Variovorax sp. LT1P1 TaxID=3443730 RepID=UPI003F477AD2
MDRYFTRIAAGLLLWCAVTVHAAEPASSGALATEREAAISAARTAQKEGPADIPLRNQAHLQLPAGYIWVPTPAAAQLMRSMGNRVDDSFIGAVFPKDDANWFAVLKFVKEGYIKDDDAKDWNADDLLKSLREGTAASNKDRAERGIPEIEVTGWAQKPAYDASTHRLVWSVTSQRKGSASADDQGINYNTYALGRDGYISLNLVTGASELATYKPDALRLLGALNYDDGKKYADFNQSTDKVAAYGLAALVAGVAAKKLGLLAIVLAFAAKFAKVLLIAGGAALWGITKAFKKQKPAIGAEASAASPPIEEGPQAPRG